MLSQTPFPGQSDSPHGVDPEQRSVSEFVLKVRHTRDRLFRDPLESQVAQVRLSSPRPSGVRCRRHVGSLDRNLRVRLPSVFHDSPGPTKNQDRPILSPPYLSPQVVQILDFHSPVPAGVGPSSTPPAPFPPATDSQQDDAFRFDCAQPSRSAFIRRSLVDKDGTLMLWKQSRKENGIPL